MRGSFSRSCSKAKLRLDNVRDAFRLGDSNELDLDVRVASTTGTYVYFAAVLESEVRKILQTYLSEVEAFSGNGFNISPTLERENYKALGQHLIELNKPSVQRGRSEMLSVIESFHLAHENNTSVPLMSEQLTYNQQNMKSKQVTALCKRIGWPEFWSKISACASIVAYYPLLQESQIETQITNDWNRIFEERDNMMHNSLNANVVGISRFEKEVVLTKLVLEAGYRLFDGYLNEEFPNEQLP